MIRQVRLRAFLLLPALLAPLPARAHPLDESRSDVTVSGRTIAWGSSATGLLTPLRSFLAIVRAFTLAHSVPLILAALGGACVASRVVDSAVALSIACVGAENFFLRSTDRPTQR